MYISQEITGEIFMKVSGFYKESTANSLPTFRRISELSNYLQAFWMTTG